MKLVESNKFNRQIYDLTFGPQTIPPMVQKLSNERMRFNYKQCKHRIFVIGDMSLQSMMVGYYFQTVAEVMDIPLAKYVILDSNNFVYSGTAEDLIVNYVRLLFLKAKSAAS